MNFLDDYSEYELEQRYYIIWYLDIYRTYEKEVTVEEFVKAIEDMDKPDVISYSIKIRYFARYKDMDFYEVNKEVFAEIYKWQHNDLYHEIYINRKYMDLYSDINIEHISENKLIEDEIIERLNIKEINNILKNVLLPSQYKVIHNIIFKNKSQSEIARENAISRQAVSRSMKDIRKKLKKYFE